MPDAFTVSVHLDISLINPPFRLQPRLLLHLPQSPCDVTIVLPHPPPLPCWLHLLAIATDDPSDILRSSTPRPIHCVTVIAGPCKPAECLPN